MNTTTSSADIRPRRRFSGLQVLGIVVAVIAVTVLATVWAVRTYVFPTTFKPVQLKAQEQQVLDRKISALTRSAGVPDNGQGQADDLTPEAYSESAAAREIRFNEKELNSLIARNPDLANRLAIDLSDNLASAKMLIPLDEDFPVMGGKTLRVNTGIEMSFTNGRPMIVLKGVSIMGVPIPNAWLGNLKNVDLIGEFGADSGFWRAFADGIEHIEVRDGQLFLKLKE